MKYLIGLLSILIFVFQGCTSTKLTRAKLYINKKDYYNARPILKDLIRENDNNGQEGYYNNAEVYYILGYIEGEQENYADMLFYFDKCQSINFKYDQNIKDTKKYYWMILFNKGVKSYNQKDYQSAKKYFESALVIITNDSETERNLEIVNAAINHKDIPIVPGTNENNLVVANDSIDDIRLIASYNGNGIKNTRPFKTDGPWEIHWQAAGSIFQVYLRSMDGGLVEILASQTESGRGSSYYPDLPPISVPMIS